jgi:hypothetical protein
MSLYEEGVKSNPIDIICQSAVEYLRGTLYDVIRYRGNTISPSDENYLIDRIKEQYELLDKMSDEQVSVCKETSMLFSKLNHYDINNWLFTLNNSFPTIWSESNPIFDDRLEKLLFGETEEYYTRDKLRKIVSAEIINFDTLKRFDEFLSECIDLIDGFEMADKHKEFLNKYTLDTQSIELMKSEIKHLMNKEKSK